MNNACITERVNSLWCINSVCFHRGNVCSELLWQNLIPTSPLVCSPMQIHLCRRCAKWSRKPSTAPTRALHAEVASVVFPIEATLLSWMTNTSALEVERCCWGGGMCFPTFQLLVSFPEYFIILPCHFEHHSTLDTVKLFHVCPRAEQDYCTSTFNHNHLSTIDYEYLYISVSIKKLLYDYFVMSFLFPVVLDSFSIQCHQY